MVQDNLRLVDMERQKLAEHTILVVVAPSTVMPGVQQMAELNELDSLLVYWHWNNV